MFLLRMNELPEELIAVSRSHDLARGETLYRKGEPVQAVFVVVYGRLQLCTFTSDGKQVPLYVVRAGECVAEAALFAEAYCSDVVAEIKSRVRAFPKKQLQNALQRNPALAAEFMGLQAKRCNNLRISLELRSLRSARERILQYLQISISADSKSIELDRPLKTVADDLGLTQESFYRTLAQLIEEGTVTRAGRVITLHESSRASSRHRMVYSKWREAELGFVGNSLMSVGEGRF